MFDYRWLFFFFYARLLSYFVLISEKKFFFFFFWPRNDGRTETFRFFETNANVRVFMYVSLCSPGVTPLEILFSHVITQFVVMCGQTALVLIFMILVFGVECKGDISLVIALTILQGLCGMCFGKWTIKRKNRNFPWKFFFFYYYCLFVLVFSQVSSYRPYVNWKGTPFSWLWEASTRRFYSAVCCVFP